MRSLEYRYENLKHKRQDALGEMALIKAEMSAIDAAMLASTTPKEPTP